MSDESTNDSTNADADEYRLETGPEWCRNRKLEKCNAEAEYVAPFPVHVLLLGPTGSGKSRLARFIHAKSGRKYKTICKAVWEGIKGESLKDMLVWAAGYRKGQGDKAKPNRQSFEEKLEENENSDGIVFNNQAFMEINLAALPQETISSELFGYVEGAYTDASKHGSPGKFIQANGGTLFLDEIADCPMEIQAKLLTVIQPRSEQDGDCACYVIPNGQEEEVRVNVHLICATNKNLAEEVRKGNFREDLYYRLKQYEITLPSLKDLKPIVSTKFWDDMGKHIDSDGIFSSADIEFFKNLKADPDETNFGKDKIVEEQFHFRWFIQKVLRGVNDQLGKDRPRYKAKQLGEKALAKLLKFRFGGNYRELQSCLMQACLNAYAWNMLNASANDENLDDADDEVIQKDHVPEEVDLEENGQPLKPNVSEVRGNSRSNVEDVQNGLAHLKTVFNDDELECLEDMLRRGVCDGASLEAVAKKMPERVQSADGAKGAGGNKEKRGSDLSDIRNFAYLIGAIEKAPDAKKLTIAESVFGKGSSTAKIDSLLGKPKNPKFGISFESIQNAVKSCASTKRPAEE